MVCKIAQSYSQLFIEVFALPFLHSESRTRLKDRLYLRQEMKDLPETTMKDVVFNLYDDTDPTRHSLSFPSGVSKIKIDYVLVSKKKSLEKYPLRSDRR